MIRKNEENIKPNDFMDIKEIFINKEQIEQEQVNQTEITKKSFPIACIGSSAGGIEALIDFLSTLDKNTGIAYIVIQHLDPSLESQLPSILSKLTKVPTVEAENEQQIIPNHIYIIPSGKAPLILNGILTLQNKATNSTQMTIDPFMRSLAEDQGSKAIGIILSGVGSDGAMGMKEIKAYGGITFVQDLKSAKYDAMPKSSINTACVDFVMKPSEMPHKLLEIIHHPYLSKISDEKDEDNISEDQEKITSIFALLHEYSGIDFTNYKRATIRRRILRRLAVNKLDSLESYAKYAEKHKPEIEELYQDLLIGVTSFFREPATYEVLMKKVFPEIFANRMGEEPIRIWVPGCSSGEEVYSILICLIEYMKEKSIFAAIQAFGTDINDVALDKTRKGFYVGNISIDVSEERLKQFFLPVGSRYQIKKALRNLCIFAKHDVINDPPFPRIDLISCRNMLIYLNPELQEKVISNFHYALKPKAILILGVSETIGDVPELFETVDKKFKIYSRSNTFKPLNLSLHASKKNDISQSKQSNEKTNMQKWQSQCDQILLAKYSPPAVVVDENLDILQFRGQDNPFLCIPEGKASLNLTKMTREVLSVEIRKIMQEVKKNLHTTKKDGIVVQLNNETRVLDLEIIPLLAAPPNPSHFLITFFDTTKLIMKSNNEESIKNPSTIHNNEAHEKLSNEANILKQNLQSTIENYEFVNRELKVANDEILFTNEELKVINEEFETTKEELQSANEELTTVNEELQERISELNVTNENFSNLFGSINIPIIVLDSELCITHMTSSAAELLHLSSGDIGRYINTLRLNIDLANINELMDKVLGGKKVTKHEIKDQKSNTYLIGMSPYRKSSKRIEGVIIDFQPIGQTNKVAKN